MFPYRSLILTSVALASVGVSGEAQTVRNKLFRRASVTWQATLDLGTGTYTRGPVAHDRGGTTVTDLSNLDMGAGGGLGWLTVDTAGCTWFNNASKGLGMNQGGQVPPGSDLMSEVFFFYCSGALDAASGGAGGAVTLGFYEGYTAFGGAPTTTATILSLTGMPGNTAPGGFFGAMRCYGLTVLLTPMVAFSDNIFVGYSWEYVNPGTTGLAGDTFPFLGCVVSCSGTSIISGNAGGIGTATGLGEDGQGMLDVIDRFCTNPPSSTTFTFATGGPMAPPFAPQTRTSISMELREAAALATSDIDYNDAAPIDNLDTLTATPATLGTTWTATFTRAGGGSGRYRIGVWRNRHPLGNGGSAVSNVPPWPAGTAGRSMTAGGFLAFVPPTGTDAYTGGVGTSASGIPLAFAFCGLHFASQARSGTGVAGTGSPRLSSAVEGTMGTF